MNINDKIGNVTILAITKHGKGYYCKFECICGKIFDSRLSKVLCRVDKSCGCMCNSHKIQSLKDDRGQFYGLEVLLKKTKERCIRKSIYIDINFSDLLKQWKKQKGKCFYTGEELFLPSTDIGRYDEKIASIDRIDSNIGYIPGNIQFVLKDVNFLKWTLSHERFIEMCHLVAKNF